MSTQLSPKAAGSSRCRYTFAYSHQLGGYFDRPETRMPQALQMVAALPVGAEPAPDGEKQPRVENGEAELAQIFERLGIRFRYEPYFYSLWASNDPSRQFGFQPDFWLEPTRRRPGLHVELTWADRGLGGKHHEASQRCLKRKRDRIRRLREMHGVETILLTYRDWQRITRRPQRLHGIIEQHLRAS